MRSVALQRLAKAEKLPIASEKKENGCDEACHYHDLRLQTVKTIVKDLLFEEEAACFVTDQARSLIELLEKTSETLGIRIQKLRGFVWL